MRMIGAQRADGSPALQERGAGVLVGIIDTGIDGNHPDIAPNFSNALSRNFTTDMPDIDGPCEYAGCVDPANVDHDGHGTHVAGTVASPVNGLGITGVAPEATLVNIRAGQDSGYFFLGPTVDALTYAGDAGIDVVNMSFYVDPWLFNCPSGDD
jgi:subtilisin family serine protease